MAKYNIDLLFKIIDKEIGYLEKASNKDLDNKTGNAGSGNYTKYWRDLNPSFQGQAWCNCFVNWCFTQAYGEAGAKDLLCTSGAWSYYTPTSASYFKNKKQWFTSSPQKGDVIYFKNTQRIHHVGIVYKVDSNYVYTAEGNTSAGSQVIPNGGGVCRKQYALSNTSIAGYGRPNYGESISTMPTTPISGSRKGFEIVGTSYLNVRDIPKTGKVVGSYKKGQLVQATAMTTVSDGKVWLQTSMGWISASYVDGWIKIGNEWKYIRSGYKFITKAVEEIDGELYAFDKEGLMITSNRINSSGAIK